MDQGGTIRMPPIAGIERNVALLGRRPAVPSQTVLGTFTLRFIGYRLAKDS